MKRGDIIGMYTSGLQKCSRNYHKVLGNFDENDIHDFRVQIKKVRAYTRLVNAGSLLHPIQIPKPIKKFYRLAGDIRNLQLYKKKIIHLANILFIEIPVLYLDWLHEEEKLKRREAEEISSHIFAKDFESQLARDTPGELTTERKTEFVKKTKSRLAQLLMFSVLYDEDIHDIRKLVKDILYNYRFLEKSVIQIFPETLNDEKKMEGLTDMLGDYHDLCLAILFLSAIYPHQFDRMAETVVPGRLKAYLDLQKENMKKEVLKRLLLIKRQLQGV